MDLTTSEWSSLSTKQPSPPDLQAEDAEARRRESEEIGSRYAAELSKRAPNQTMSPEYLATLPKSLAEKLRVTPEEEEEIFFHYASTSSIPKTASLSGLSLDKVRAIIYSPASQNSLRELREAMGASVIQKIEETQTILLEAMQDPGKLSSSSITQIASVFQDISETQMGLLAAAREQTGATVALSDPTSVFSGDELEYMAFLRRRLTAPASQLSAGPSESTDTMSGHEFIDPEYEDVPPKKDTQDSENISTPWDLSATIDGTHIVEESVEE